MLQLEWIFAEPVDDDGDKEHNHYLIDYLSTRCFAIVRAPKSVGSILYVTDVRVVGEDRSFISLEAAKRYCEEMALAWDLDQNNAMKLSLDVAVPKSKKPSWLSKVFSRG